MQPIDFNGLDTTVFVKAEKAFVGRRPKTTYYLTKKGRAALTLQSLLVAMGRTSPSP
jgi:hypothetical protein